MKFAPPSVFCLQENRMAKRKLSDFNQEIEEQRQFLDELSSKKQHTLDSDESDNENEE